MDLKQLYYIFRIGDFEYLIHRKGYEKTAFDKLQLRSFIGKDKELNLLCGKGNHKIFIPFGKSEKLVDILTSRGVARAVWTIESANEEMDVFNLRNGDELNVCSRSSEGGTYYEYRLKSSRGVFYKGYSSLPAQKILGKKVEFLFEGPASNDKPPKEVKDFLSSRNTKNKQNDFAQVLVFIIIVIILAWLLI